MMNDLIFNVLLAVVATLMGIIVHQLFPYLKAKQVEITTSIRRTEWWWAADIIDAVVRAVEQTVAEGVHGQNKKDLAIAKIKAILAYSGIVLTDSQIDTLIEAAVQAMNNENVTAIEMLEGGADRLE